jgi:hypothetical protein
VSKTAYAAVIAGVFLTIWLGATFGIIGLLTGLAMLFIMKPLLEDIS